MTKPMFTLSGSEITALLSLIDTVWKTCGHNPDKERDEELIGIYNKLREQYDYARGKS